ncbi:MAG: hypothetical protein PVI57_02730 [Gemmatimonadota bacterium]
MPAWQRWLNGGVILVALAKGYRSLRSAAEEIPGFESYERLSRTVVARVFGAVRLPESVGGLLEPYLEARAARRMDPPLVFALWVVVGCLGLYPSYLGHLDTTPGVFAILPFVSGVNPFVGLITALDFSLLDWIGKWLPFESVYGADLGDGLHNYFGARGGYLFAYSTVLLAGVLPGVLARVARAFVYRLLRGSTPRTGAAAGVVALVGAGTLLLWCRGGEATASVTLATAVVLMTRSAFTPGEGGVSESLAQAAATIAGMVGGTVGALGTLEWARAVGNDFAFEHFRSDPDISCKNLSEANWIGRRGSTGLGGALGGAAPPGSGLVTAPGGLLGRVLSGSAPEALGLTYVNLLEEPTPPPPEEGAPGRDPGGGPTYVNLLEEPGPPPPEQGTPSRDPRGGPTYVKLPGGPGPPPPAPAQPAPPVEAPTPPSPVGASEQGLPAPPPPEPPRVVGPQVFFGGSEALEILERKGLVRRTAAGWQAVGGFPDTPGSNLTFQGETLGELVAAGWQWVDEGERLIDPDRIAITVVASAE